MIPDAVLTLIVAGTFFGFAMIAFIVGYLLGKEHERERAAERRRSDAVNARHSLIDALRKAAGKTS